MQTIRNIEIIVHIEVNQIVDEDRKLILARARKENCCEMSRDTASDVVGNYTRECCDNVLSTLNSPLMVDNFESVLRASRSLDARLTPQDIKDGE